jgi:hypothetical protein
MGNVRFATQPPVKGREHRRVRRIGQTWRIVDAAIHADGGLDYKRSAALPRQRDEAGQFPWNCHCQFPYWRVNPRNARSRVTSQYEVSTGSSSIHSIREPRRRALPCHGHT